jgi:hypothetical protein
MSSQKLLPHDPEREEVSLPILAEFFSRWGRSPRVYRHSPF